MLKKIFILILLLFLVPHTSEAAEPVQESCLVYFDANGGTVDVPHKKVSFGKEYGELPVPTRLGYDFVGWFTSKSGKTQVYSTSIVNIAVNHKIFAIWKATPYVVTFHSKGTLSFNACKAYYNSPINFPKAKRTGYKFDGWYTADGQKYTENSVLPSASNLDLYANWKDNAKITLKWQKSSVAKGYQIQVSTSKKFKKGTVTTYTSKKASKTIKGLVYKKKYYVRVRAYAKKGKKTVYGKWSSKKKFVAKA